MECLGKMHDFLNDVCFNCTKYNRCYTLSKVQKEQIRRRDIEKLKQDERYKEIFRKKGYAV